jgi:transcriptional regulator with XRE-family HTH domain
MKRRLVNHLRNYLRTYRKKAGLSQRDVGLLLGREEGQIARHESSYSKPPLALALQYEALFHVPVSKLFDGAYESAEDSMKKRLAAFEATLKTQDSRRGRERGREKKLQWLLSRKDGASTTQVNERLSSGAPHGMRSSDPKTRIRGL